MASIDIAQINCIKKFNENVSWWHKKIKAHFTSSTLSVPSYPNTLSFYIYFSTYKYFW